MFRIIRCAALLLLVAGVPAGATDYYVSINGGSNQTGDGLSPATAWRNITYALGQITGDGHTIHVAPGVYDDTPDGGGLFEVYPLTLGANLSLIGSGSASTVLDAEQKARVLTISGSTANPVIEGFTITNGKLVDSAQFGGGLYIADATVTLRGLLVTANTTNGKGGGICAENSVLTMEDVVLSFNESTAAGGGAGGGMALLSSHVTATTVLVESNIAYDGGGGLLVRDLSSFTATDRLCVRNNTADVGVGGGIHLWGDSTLSLARGAVLEGNRCHHGGAIGVQYCSNVDLKDCVFSNNSAVGNNGMGGAIYTNGGNVRVEECAFEGNLAAQHGGAIRVSPEEGEFFVERCILRDNMAGDVSGPVSYANGGAISFYASGDAGVVVLRDSQFIGNSVTCPNECTGAAVYLGSNTGSFPVVIEGCVFRGNVMNTVTRQQGIAVRVRSGSSVIVSDNVFEGNFTTGALGATTCFYAECTSTEVYRNAVIGNDGGGMYVGSLGGNTVSNNYIAGSGEYGLHVGCNSLVSHNTVVNNSGHGIICTGYSDHCVTAQQTVSANVIVSNTGIGIQEGTAGADVTAYNNLFFNNAGGIFRDEGLTTYTDLALLESQVPEVFDNLEGDPLFLGAAAGNYRLQAGSPCIDAGTSTNAPSVDFDGEPRPQGAGYDIGADERHGAHAADANENLVIEDFEMLHYVDDWAADPPLVTQPELDEARTLWRCLKGYRADGGGAWECR